MSNCGSCKYLNTVLKLRVEKYVLQLVRKVMLRLQTELSTGKCILFVSSRERVRSEKSASSRASRKDGQHHYRLGKIEFQIVVVTLL